MGLSEDRSKLEIEFRQFKQDFTKNYDFSKDQNYDILNEKTRTISIMQNELRGCEEELSYSQNIIKEMTIERNDMVAFLEKYKLGPLNNEE